MPYENVPDDKIDEMDACVEKVMSEGKDKEAAIAICYASIVEGKAMPAPVLDWSPASETIVYMGDTVKAVDMEDGGVKVGGYLVRFGSADDPDVSAYRDYFTPSTDFDIDLPGKSTVYFQHGLDANLKRRKFERATLTQDDFGIWAETILRERDDYEKFLIEMAREGKLAWSSGTASHLVERKSVGDAHEILRWPLGLDASLTHTPAEPRNNVLPLKSLLESEETEPVQEPEAVGETAETEAAAEPEIEEEVNHDGGIDMEITEEKFTEMMSAAVSQGVAEALKSLPADNTKAGGVVVTKDESDQDWRDAGEFLMAVKNVAFYPGKEDPRLRALKATGASEGVPADGGYLVNKQFAGGILDRVYQTGEILSRVSQDPVMGNNMTYHAVDETSRADGSQWGGVTAYWVAEGGTITASKGKFRDIDLKLQKIAALSYATDELLSDVGALASWLGRVVPEVLRTKVEASLYRGDGLGKPLGLINSPCVVSPLREDANYIKLSDVLAMYKRRWPGGRYVWLIHQDAFPQLLQLQATGLTNLFLPYGAIANVPYNTLLGLPVIESEHCSSLGTYGDFALVDLSQYQTIVNGGIKADSSIHVAFTTDEMAYRWTYRIAGAPTWNSALTPMNGSNTMSPFVVLSAASV